jgi:hypothetical protein
MPRRGRTEDDLMNEIVGDWDMVGGPEDDYEDEVEGPNYDMVGEAYEIVGERGGRQPVPMGRRKQLRGPQNYLWRRQSLGVTSAAPVAAGAPAQIISRPQRDFKSKRLVCSSDIAFFFDITDFKVGQDSQNVASGTLPASMFTEDAVSVFLDWDTANVGNEITLFVQNIDVADHPFRAGIVGLVAMAQY